MKRNERWVGISPTHPCKLTLTTWRRTTGRGIPTGAATTRFCWARLAQVQPDPKVAV